MMKKGGIILLIVLASWIAYASVFQTTPETLITQETPVQAVELPKPTVEELYRLTNEERVKAGVKPLELNPLLNKSAQMKADDMLANNYFDHVNPTTGKNGPTYVMDVGADCYYQSENLSADLTSEGALVDWRGSEPHYGAIISPRYDSTGFGIAKGSDYYYVVQHFCDSV